VIIPAVDLIVCTPTPLAAFDTLHMKLHMSQFRMARLTARLGQAPTPTCDFGAPVNRTMFSS
jgi:hypothetical protein